MHSNRIWPMSAVALAVSSVFVFAGQSWAAVTVNGTVSVDGVKTTYEKAAKITVGEQDSVVDVAGDKDSFYVYGGELVVNGKTIQATKGTSAVYVSQKGTAQIGSVTTEKVSFTAHGDKAISAWSGASAKINAADITLGATQTTSSSGVSGVFAKQADIEVGGEENRHVTIVADSQAVRQKEGVVSGVYAQNGAQISIGGAQTEAVSVSASHDDLVYAVRAENTKGAEDSVARINIRGQQINIHAHSSDGYENPNAVGDGIAYGVVARHSAQVTLGEVDSDAVVVIAEHRNQATGLEAQSVFAKPSTIDVLGKSIAVTAKSGSDSTGILSNTGARLSLGNEATQDLSIQAITTGTTGDEKATAVWVNNDNSAEYKEFGGGKVNLVGKNINIYAEGAGQVRAIHVATNDLDQPKHSSLNIQGENISIVAKSTGEQNVASALVAMSAGEIAVSGNAKIAADNAILTRGNSNISINADSESIAKGYATQIDGDLNFNFDAGSSNTAVDAVVKISLNGADSYWNGNIRTTWDEKPQDEDRLAVSQTTLTLQNGAQWTVTEVADSEAEHSQYTALNNLVLDGGVINVTEGTQTLKVEKVSGAGGTINVATTEGADGAMTVDRKIEIGEAAKSTNLTVTDPTLNADTVKDSDKVLAALNGAVSTTTGEITQTNRIEEGAIKGAITETVVGGQSQGVVQAENTKLSAFGSVAALSAFQWRHDMNDLTKRMGELRTSPEGIGSWVRLYGSEQEYGALQAKNTSIQVGSDVDVGMGWKVGAAFSYTDGNATYADGDADNKAYGLGIYGTWMAENGQFVDLIAKYSRLDTDFALNGMNGGFDNNAYSVSAEYGWHLKLGEYAFVEPQAELTYGQVLGDTFTTGNGVKVEQDDFDAFIGRIGVRGGFHFPDNKGVVYVRASVLHDFEGESTAVASLINDSSVRNGIHEDLGGTWYEVGVGANFNVTDNTYTYVDLEKTSGGEVKENWRWNIGLRHTF